jgi:hypothetical protein
MERLELHKVVIIRKDLKAGGLISTKFVQIPNNTGASLETSDSPKCKLYIAGRSIIGHL